MATKLIAWSKRPITVEEGMWIVGATLPGGYLGVVKLVISRSDGQLTEAETMKMPMPVFGVLVEECAASVKALDKPDLGPDLGRLWGDG